MVSKAEMSAILEGTGWGIQRFIDVSTRCDIRFSDSTRARLTQKALGTLAASKRQKRQSETESPAEHVLDLSPPSRDGERDQSTP